MAGRTRWTKFTALYFQYSFWSFPFHKNAIQTELASEVFQKKNEEAFSGIDGVHIMADDIIIAAATVEKHDAILQRVLERARERNVKFNLEKLQLRVNKVKYLGAIISEEGIKPDPAKVNAITNMQVPNTHNQMG